PLGDREELLRDINACDFESALGEISSFHSAPAANVENSPARRQKRKQALRSFDPPIVLLMVLMPVLGDAIVGLGQIHARPSARPTRCVANSGIETPTAARAWGVSEALVKPGKLFVSR